MCAHCPVGIRLTTRSLKLVRRLAAQYDWPGDRKIKKTWRTPHLVIPRYGPCDTPDCMQPCEADSSTKMTGTIHQACDTHNVHFTVTRITQNSSPNPVHCTRCPMSVLARSETQKVKTPRGPLDASMPILSNISSCRHEHPSVGLPCLGPHGARTPHNSSSKYLYTNLKSGFRRFILSRDL